MPYVGLNHEVCVACVRLDNKSYNLDKVGFATNDLMDAQPSVCYAAPCSCSYYIPVHNRHIGLGVQFH